MTTPQRLSTLAALILLALSLAALYDLAPHWGADMPQRVRVCSLVAGMTGLAAFAVLWERASWFYRNWRPS